MIDERAAAEAPASTAEALRIWLLDEGSPGHRAQSKGVVAALARLGYAPSVATVDIVERRPGVLRSPARFLVSHGPGRFAAWTGQAMSGFVAPNEAPPSLILSSGGKSAFASVSLARETGAPNVFVGDPRPYPAHWFDAVLSPHPIAGAANVSELAAPPTSLEPERCVEAARARWPSGWPDELGAVLIGGASRSHRFVEADFAALGAGLSALARRTGRRWLIATSRRTGLAAEEVLRAHLDEGAVFEATYYARTPAPVVAAYLGAAEVAFVTQDSLTMLSEAVASGRAVVALAPANVRLPVASVVTSTLANLERLEGFARWPIRAMPDRVPPIGMAPNGAVAARLDEALARCLPELGL